MSSPPLSKIDLWRKTILLFHEHKKPHFIGPFKVARFQYRIENKMLTKSGEERDPDIVAANPDSWLIVELTTDIASNESQLASDKNMDPRFLSNIGFEVKTTPPDVISSRLELVDDGNHCQIILGDKFNVTKQDGIKNPQLRDALEKFDGSDLRVIPEIPISFVPETHGKELRKGLVDLILQIFKPDSEGKSSYDIAIEGFGPLAGLMPAGKIKGTQKRIENEMIQLVNTNLKGYMTIKDGKYLPTDKWTSHPRSISFIGAKLRDWSGSEAPVQVRLETSQSEFPAAEDEHH